MKPERWGEVDRLYHEALDRDPASRSSFLDEACAGDDELRGEIASLLASDEQAGSFLAAPAIALAARALAAEPLIEASIKPTPSLVAGSQIGAYHLLEPLGRGGMGEVHLALDTRLGRKIAVKLLPSAFTTEADRVQRFAQEARAASALNHPNIITIHEIGEATTENGGVSYIVTEYIEGETLRQRMASAPQQRLEPPAAIDIALQIAAALAAAHEAGIAHRDIKPENVMVRRDGIVKVLDFGLAKLTEEGQGDREKGRQEDRETRRQGDRETGRQGDRESLNLPFSPSPCPLVSLSPCLPLSLSFPPSLSFSGMVMGTPRYMSPEQARGEKVDARTDIFSLGVTLYEMITGRTPFVGSTPDEMIAAILHDEPPPLGRYAPETPPELQRLVGKALCKNREERYQGIKDLLLDLKSIKQDLELEAREAGGRIVETGEARATSRAGYLISEIKRHKRATLLALVAVAGIAFGLYRSIGFSPFGLARPAKPAPPLPAIKFDRLTNNGKAGAAAISPDGKYVAYTEREEGKQSLWIRQTTIASAVQIVPPAAIWYYWLSFSRDGDVLYYLADDAADGNSVRKTLYQISVFGSATPRKLIANIWSSVALSPDGKRLAFVRWQFNQSERTLMLANVDGSGAQKLATSNSLGVFLRDLAWSPDGKIISCGVATPDDRATVIAVNVADGTQRPITSRRLVDVRSMAWLADGSGLIMQASDPAEGPQPQIWRLSYPDGEARKLTNDLNNYQGISLAANSNILVTVKVDYTSNMWIAPYGKAGRAIQVTSGTNIEEGQLGLAWTPDGKIVYTSTESGNWDIWIVDADGSHKQQLTANAGRNFCPSVSPDGRYIVFGSDRTGVEDIWRMDINGGNLKQLTRGHIASRPYCSPDGPWVVYRNSSSGTATVWKVSIDGGAPTRLTGADKPAASPVISPDGKLLSYLVLNEQNKPALNIIPFAGGEIIKTIDMPADVKMSSNHVWTADGRGVICRRTNGNGSNLWQQPLDSSPPTQLTDFKSNGIPWFDLSRDGKQLALSRSVLSGEVVLISNFR